MGKEIISEIYKDVVLYPEYLIFQVPMSSLLGASNKEIKSPIIQF